MNDLTIGLLSALLATNQPQAVSNVIHQQTGVAVAIAADPTEKELRTVMMADDAAQDEVNAWMQTFDGLGTNRTKEAGMALNQRILARFEQVRTAYGTFLRNHPDSAKGFLAYGSFLNDIGDEEGAKVQYENSKQLDPKNPAVWNQLANYYGEFSPVTNAFAYYTEAIRLDPSEPMYYQNFATTVYLFRKDAREFYRLTEQQVFDKALGLYKQAMQIAPKNFVLATDYAESYYGIKPLRTNDALVAWTNAMQVAQNDAERQGVEIHLARVKIAAGFYEQASNHLAAVTNSIYFDLKKRLYRSLLDHKNPPPEDAPALTTNTVPAPVVAPLPVASPPAGSTNTEGLPLNLLTEPPSLREQKP
jgi:cytochrome c-type biogenesis protein CcmH/NrfG